MDEGDVFALIGPKRYDVPWRNWKVKVYTTELHRDESASRRRTANGYALTQRQQFRVAAENPRKVKVVKNLLEQEAS